MSRVCGHRGGAGDLQPAQQHGKAASCKPGPQLFPRGTVRLSSSGVCLLLFPRSAAASQAFCAAKPCRRADSFRPEENEIRVPCPALAGQGIKAASCKPGPQLLPRGAVRLSSSGVCLLLFPRSAAASQAFCAAKPCRRADSFRPEENEIRVPCPALAGQGIKAASCKPGPQLLPRGTVSCRFLSRLPCCFSPAAQPRPKRFAQQNLAEGRIHSARVRSALIEPLPSGECPIKDF